MHHKLFTFSIVISAMQTDQKTHKSICPIRCSLERENMQTNEIINHKSCAWDKWTIIIHDLSHRNIHIYHPAQQNWDTAQAYIWSVKSCFVAAHSALFDTRRSVPIFSLQSIIMSLKGATSHRLECHGTHCFTHTHARNLERHAGGGSLISVWR